VFQWEYLNLAHIVSCGAHKCYFRRIINNDDHQPPSSIQSLSFQNSSNNSNNSSSSNNNNSFNVHPTVAYLITTENEKNNWMLWKATWDLAQTLHYNYSQPDYFLLDPPQTIPVDEKWAARLNASLMAYHDSGRVVTPRYHQDRFRAGQLAVVQNVRPAPVPSLLYGVTVGKEQYFWDHLDQDLLRYVTDVQAFEQRVLHQIKSSLNFLRRNPQFHCLLFDYQVLMDTQGIFHLMDLHRCMNHTDGTLNVLEPNHIRRSFLRMERFRRRIVKYLKTYREMNAL
jgi:hypothetical protein